MDELSFIQDAYYMMQNVDVIMGNFKVAKAMIKLRYDSIRKWNS